MFVLSLLFKFKFKSYRNLVAKMVPQPEVLVTKAKVLVALGQNQAQFQALYH